MSCMPDMTPTSLAAAVAPRTRQNQSNDASEVNSCFWLRTEVPSEGLIKNLNW